MNEPKPQRMAAWMLIGWFAVHVFLLPSNGLSSALTLLVLGWAVLNRRINRDVPFGPWVAVLGAGILLGMWTGSQRLFGFVGFVASWCGAVLLLRPLTSKRGLWVMFCAVMVLSAVVLHSREEFPVVALILDVGLLMLLAHQVQIPEGTQGGFLLRSLRLVIPVAAVVTAVFWVFPAISSQANIAVSGFSSGLNPSEFEMLHQSRKLAFTARFPEGSPVPKAKDLYWRAEVMDNNHGMAWTVDPARRTFPYNPNPESWVWGYFVNVSPGRPVAPMELPVTTSSGNIFHGNPETGRNDPEGSMYLQSSAAPPRDAPESRFARKNLMVPEFIAENKKLNTLTATLFEDAHSTREKLGALGKFLKEGGFRYTLRSGRIETVEELLLKERRGYCEHYAAASANLLRLAGVPTRVVGGYRGGQWNPWDRTIAVRDFHAHAWLECWDAEAGHWVRFDPTFFLAPEVQFQIEQDIDPALWPWHRHVAAFLGSRLAMLGRALDAFLGAIAAHAAWGAGALLTIGVGVYFFTRQRNRDAVEATLQILEAHALRYDCPRLAGETVLSWLKRLASQVSAPAEVEALNQLSELYEKRMFGRVSSDDNLDQALRETARKLRRVKRRRQGEPQILHGASSRLFPAGSRK